MVGPGAEKSLGIRKQGWLACGLRHIMAVMARVVERSLQDCLYGPRGRMRMPVCKKQA